MAQGGVWTIDQTEKNLKKKSQLTCNVVFDKRQMTLGFKLEQTQERRGWTHLLEKGGQTASDILVIFYKTTLSRVFFFNAPIIVRV